MKTTNRHLRKLKRIAPVFCSIAVLSTQLQAGPTVQLNGDEMRDGMADSGSLGYVGGNTRIGVSINRDLEGQVDLNQIIMEDDSSATSAEGWFGYKIKDDEHSTKGLTAGGVKLNHQWVNDEQDTVHKVFGAYDRDVDDRAKATVGYGQETEDLFWSGHVSKSISDETVTGGVATRAYDYGVGAQVGTFMESTLTRIRGGLDYEFGTEYADGEDRPGKATISAGVEQFFHDSPHSISLDVSGNQVSGGNDAENTDYNARLGYRYEFGGDGVFQSGNKVSRRRVEIPGTPGRPGRAAVPAIPPTPAIAGRPATRGRAATPGRPGRAAIPPRYERRAVAAPGHEFVKTTMKLENETFFKLNSSKLTQSAKRNLDKIVGQIRGHGYLGQIRITGNTCGLGNPTYDQRLSENRARAVKDYLVDKGFNPDHLIARGLGKGSPKYDRQDDDFRNRRVDLEYVTERTVKKAANKTQYRDVLVQEGRPAVAPIPARPAQPGRPAIPGRAGHPGRPAIPAIPATPGTPSRFVWKTEVVPSAPVWIKRAVRNTISHNKAISTYTTSVATKTVDDSFTATNRDIVMDVLANDGDSTNLTITGFSQPSHGTVTIINNGKAISYVADPNFSGDDTFTYTVTDADGNQMTSRVTVNVPAGANNSPVAVDDSATTGFETPVTINVVSNDTDVESTTTCISNIATQPSNGTVAISANGTDIVYTPNDGFSGTDTFVYTACDDDGGTDTATVTVVVDPASTNQPPKLIDDVVTTPLNTNITIDVTANDTDPDGDTLTVTGTTTPANGSVSTTGNNVVYTPNNNYSGQDTFDYTVTDNQGNTVTAMVTVNITGATNQNPVAMDDSATTGFETPVTINVVNNDTDAESTTTCISGIATQPGNGSVAISANGTDIVYTPADGFSGTDTFVYTACDDDGGTDTATVTVVVDPAATNQPPMAVDDEVTTPFNNAITIDPTVNDTDSDGDTLEVTGTTDPANGSVTTTGNNIVYTPDNNFTGQDTFDYTITDGQGNNVTATVIVNVSNNTNQNPVAVDDSATTPFETPVSINVVSNDTDAESTTTCISGIATQPGNGAVAISANGTDIVYTPEAGFSGTDTFVYTACDDDGATDTATVTVTVDPSTNQPPMATDDDFSTPLNTAITIDPTVNDTDSDGDTLEVTGTTNPANGSVSTTGNNVVYTPDNNFTGQDTFEYTITDGQGNNVTATVTVTVEPANQAPKLTDDEVTTPFNTAIVMDVTNNDTDPDGDTLSVISTTNPDNGSVTTTGNNITYTPANGFTGVDSYTYTVTDNNGNNATATAVVNVSAGTLGIDAVDDTANTDYETDVTINVASNDTDLDGGAYTCVRNIVTDPANGSLEISTTGQHIIYKPYDNFTGTDTFVYTACDADGDLATATVTVNVGAPPVNLPPVLSPNYAGIQGYFPVTIRVLEDDSDPEGDTLSIERIHTGPFNGTATISGDVVIYEAANGYVGADSFYYEVSDGNGNLVSERVDIDVKNDNTDPEIATIPAITANATGSTTTDIASYLSDADGDTVHVAVADALSGTITFSGTVLTYTPNYAEVSSGGTDTIYLTVSDGQGGTASSDGITVHIP